MRRLAAHITPNRCAALIALGFVLLGITYSAVTPIFEAPDELAHFVYIDRLLDRGALNSNADRAQMLTARNVQAHQHPLYYLAGALVAAPFDRDDLPRYTRFNPFASIGQVTGTNANVQLHPLTHTGGTVYAVWAVRLLSLSMATATLGCVYLVGRQVSGPWAGVAAMLLAASIPTFIHISTSVNNDNLNTMLNALTIATLVTVWHTRKIRRVQAVALAFALTGITLTKLTGVVAYGYAVGTLLLGGAVGRFRWRDVLAALGTIVLVFAVFGAWWFVRNLTLYGDLLASTAPAADFWTRAEPRWPDWHEVNGIWRSFWMVLGHLNIGAPGWVLPYVNAAVLLAVLGVILRGVRAPSARWDVTFMVGVVALGWAVLIVVTSRVNISQGRALFITLAALAPLLVTGWRTMLGPRLMVLPVLPLTALAIATPFIALWPAFPPLEQVTSEPPRRVDVRAESLTLHGYALHTPTVSAGESLTLDLWFSGAHPDNPALFVNMQHPLTEARLGGVDTYPGGTATDTLHTDATYKTRLRVPITVTDDPLPPAQTRLAIGWRVPDADDPGTGRFLPLQALDGTPLDVLFVPGPVYIDPAYTPPEMTNPLDVRFGDSIALQGYDLSRDGDQLTVDLRWAAAAAIPQDYTLTIGLVDASGELLTQQDAPPPGYPTSAWLPDAPPFVTSRALDIPTDTNLDDLRVRVGWYLPDTGQRLPVTQVDGVLVQNDLLLLPAC